MPTSTHPAPRKGSKYWARPNVRAVAGGVRHEGVTLYASPLTALTSPTPGKKTHAADSLVMSDVDLSPELVIHHPTRKSAIRKLQSVDTEVKKGRRTPHAYAYGKVLIGGRSPKVDVSTMARLQYSLGGGHYHLDDDKSKKVVTGADLLVMVPDGHQEGVRGGFYVAGPKYSGKRSSERLVDEALIDQKYSVFGD